MAQPLLHTDTALAKGPRKLFVELEARIDLKRSMNVHLAGGMAMHLFTASRVTTHVDAEFAGKALLPNDLLVDVTLEDGSPRVIYLDTNYNSTFALLHEDYQLDALAVEFDLQQLRLFVLCPVDLAVSKIARLSDIDKEDIQALVTLGLVTMEAIQKRALTALAGYVGRPESLLLNLRDVLQLQLK